MAIADDQDLVPASLRMIIDAEADLEVVGEASNVDEAVAIARDLRPDIFLMDVRLPGLDGIAATERILGSAQGSPPRILMLTTLDLDEYVYRALRSGATGFLLKDIPGEDLVIGIRQAARGADVLLAPSVTRRLVERFASRGTKPPGRPEALAELTARGAEILTLVAQGLSNAEIAQTLHIGETTVKTHVAHLLMKLRLRDRVQAVVLAYESGLLASRVRR